MKKILQKTSLMGILVAMSSSVNAIEMGGSSERNFSVVGKGPRGIRMSDIKYTSGTCFEGAFRQLSLEDRKILLDLVRQGIENALFLKKKGSLSQESRVFHKKNLGSVMMVVSGHLKGEEKERFRELIQKGQKRLYETFQKEGR